MTTEQQRPSPACARCGAEVEDDGEAGIVTWEDRPYCSVECSVRHEREKGSSTCKGPNNSGENSDTPRGD